MLGGQLCGSLLASGLQAEVSPTLLDDRSELRLSVAEDLDLHASFVRRFNESLTLLRRAVAPAIQVVLHDRRPHIGDCDQTPGPHGARTIAMTCRSR